MKATTWEFRNRAMVFGLIFGLSFPLYAIDHHNAGSWIADHLSTHTGIEAGVFLPYIFAIAAVPVALCALVRTWASAYLLKDVVYAADVQTAALVADGPYRYVRNPLYFGNVLMALGMGLLASRVGFLVLVAGVTAFCYRLILREESELSATQGESYEAYRRAVPRLLMSPVAKVPSAGTNAQWAAALRAEAWCWSLPIGMIAFAATLNLGIFFAAAGVALAAAWIWNRLGSRKPV